jgi:hypothetical protein
MRNPLFTLYGLTVLFFGAWGSYRGWSPFSGGREQIVSPKSVRDNPGAYRPVYSWYHRYSGGK